jgi:hypothetical protein
MRWFGCVVGGLFILPIGVAEAVTAVVEFQNGLNSYTGTFDRRIHPLADPAPPSLPLTFDGATRTQMALDGYELSANSEDIPVLMRFENLIGNGPNQIPAGATILNATMRVVTSTAGAAQSPGPWAVAQLLQPFGTGATGTRYFGTGTVGANGIDGYTCNGCSLGSRGPWWEDGYTKRPLAAFGQNWQGEVAVADVRAIVQNWVNGDANNGVVIQTGFSGSPVVGGTSDGWNILSTGHPLNDNRPKLSVTYTTDPIEFNTFQRGLNGYASDSMAYVKSGTNIFGTTSESDAGKDDITYDGATGNFTVAANSTIVSPAPLTSFQQFLDGPQFPADDLSGVAASVDDFTLLKFGNVFGNGPNQAPTDVPVARAWVALSTGTASGNAPSNGEWSIHRVLRNWDTTTLHTGLGPRPGLEVSDSDITEAIDTSLGIIFGSEVWFDVTSYLEGVRTGATDNGLAVLTKTTADGWQIHLNGSPDADLRPRLLVASGNTAIVSPPLPGDFNDDGKVDAADYVRWRKALNTNDDLSGNGNESGGSAGIVDQADYAYWRLNFGAMSGGSGPTPTGVPEPGTVFLLASALLATPLAGRRR